MYILKLPFDNIQIEISGKCNARCLYCVTGQQNRQHKMTGTFIKPDNLKRAIEFLYKKKYIDVHTCIALFNYGEPLLHPALDKIVEIVESYGNPYELSTNGSVRLNRKIIEKMNHIKCIQFSMCGFSQQSYDRIHGFNFHQVKENITRMVGDFHYFHPQTECLMKLQVYAFNENEVQPMIEYSQKLGMTVIPLHALYANLQQQIDFITNYQKTQTIPDESDLLWYYLPDIFKDGVEEKSCLQHSSLVIDENLNVALCCMVTKQMNDYKICNLFELTEHHLTERISSDLCKFCMRQGVSKSICCTPSYKKNYEYNKILKSNAYNKKREIIVVGNSGLEKSFQKMYPEFLSENNFIPYLDDITCLIWEENLKSPFWILADSQYWMYEKILLNIGKRENIDFMIYNTYLR